MKNRTPLLIAIAGVGLLVIVGSLWWGSGDGAPMVPRDGTPSERRLEPGSLGVGAPASRSESPGDPSIRAPVEPGGTDEVASGFRVQGLVVDVSAQPVGGATVWLSEQDQTATGSVVAESAPDGSFELPAVVGHTVLVAWAPGCSTSEPWPLFAGEGDVVNVRLVVGNRAATIAGVVEDSAGASIEGADVWVGSSHEGGRGILDTLASLDGSTRVNTAKALLHAPPFRLRSDAEGKFEAANAWAGVRCAVYARADGYSSWMDLLTLQPGERVDVRIVLHRPAVVMGTVTNESGEPCPGTEITAGERVRGKPPWFRYRTTTDARGEYRLGGLGPGAVRMSAKHVGSGSASDMVTLVSDAETKWDPRLDAGLKIIGRLVTESGDPVPGAHVSATPARGHSAGGRPDGVLTDDAGRFQLIQCSDAAYRLYAVERGSWVGPTLVHVPEIRPARQEQTLVVAEAKLPSCFISGEIRDENGPVTDANMGLVWGNDTGGAKSTGEHRVGSAFRIGPEPPGRYLVRLFRQGFPAIELGPFDLAPRESKSLGQIVFQQFGSVFLTVRDESGATVPVRAQIERASGGGSMESAAASGDIQFTQLAPDDYVLRVTADGRVPRRRLVRAMSGIETRVDLTLRAGVEQRFALQGFFGIRFGSDLVFRWKTADGETLFVETGGDFAVDDPRDVAPVEISRSFAPGRYVLVVERGAKGLLDRVIQRAETESPAEYPFEISDSPSAEPITIVR